MTDEEKVEEAKVRKEKGNVRFKAGKWQAALDKYKVRTPALAPDDPCKCC